MPKLPRYLSLNFLVLAAIAIATIIRIVNLGSREFWYDEILSLLLSAGQKKLYENPTETPVLLSSYLPLLNLPQEKGLGDFLTTTEQFFKGLVAEPHPPLFFIGQYIWLRLFGNSEIATRSLVALYSLGAMGSAYGLGRCLIGHRGGLLFAAAIGLNPFYLFHSLNVRMYGSLVFWTILSFWALIELIDLNTQAFSETIKKRWLWSLVLIIAIAGGLMTFYYFACLLVPMGILVLWLDRRRWLQYGLCFGTGILMNVPWILWGTRQQLNNADLGRFSASNNWLQAMSQHLQEVTQTVGIHLILGDWASSMPPILTTIAGIVAIAILIACSLSLWKHNQYRVLGIALLLGVFPLLMMLSVDIITKKFTLGFGWGRSVIFVLPGCLFLLVVWIEKAAQKWQKIATISLLILYLGISSADFSLRHRWMFHEIADIIEQKPNEQTAIVMNSFAWGHVLRLAYYLPPTSPVALLARPSDKLIPALQKTLTSSGERAYQRIIWLESARPVWGKPTTPEQKQQIQQLLQDNQYQPKKTLPLVGTWELDNFNLTLYEQDAN
jgi:uncharacterized membrane protein